MKVHSTKKVGLKKQDLQLKHIRNLTNQNYMLRENKTGVTLQLPTVSLRVYESRVDGTSAHIEAAESSRDVQERSVRM